MYELMFGFVVVRCTKKRRKFRVQVEYIVYYIRNRLYFDTIKM